MGALVVLRRSRYNDPLEEVHDRAQQLIIGNKIGIPRWKIMAAKRPAGCSRTKREVTGGRNSGGDIESRSQRIARPDDDLEGVRRHP